MLSDDHSHILKRSMEHHLHLICLRLALAMQIPENSNVADAICHGCLQSCLLVAFRDFQKISRSISFRPPPGAIGIILHLSINEIESELESIAAHLKFEI